jgi:hypothetical protein
MNPIQTIQPQTQPMVRKLFLHYKLAQALVFIYFLVELMTLGLTTIAHFSFGMSPVYAFAAFLGLSSIYTFFFFMAFSYFLYNISKPRPRNRYF